LTFEDLARSYQWKAHSRRRALDLYLEDENFSDVIRESQELVELCLKAILRHHGVDPPRVHDVGPSLASLQASLPEPLQVLVPQIVIISQKLRKEREMAFYGDVDLIPTQLYSRTEALQALAWVDEVIAFTDAALDR